MIAIFGQKSVKVMLDPLPTCDSTNILATLTSIEQKTNDGLRRQRGILTFRLNWHGCRLVFHEWFPAMSTENRAPHDLPALAAEGVSPSPSASDQAGRSTGALLKLGDRRSLALLATIWLAGFVVFYLEREYWFGSLLNQPEFNPRVLQRASDR